MKLYPGFRHEILNEVNKNEVYNDISNWLNCVILKNRKYLSDAMYEK